MQAWQRPTPGVRAYRTWALLAALAFLAVLAASLGGGNRAAQAAAAGQSISLADDGDGGPVGAYSSIALDATGFPIVSYQDTSAGDLRILHCNDADCSGGDESITAPDTAGNVGEHTALALDDAGFPVVVYSDETDNALNVLHCNDGNCSGGDESIASPVSGTREWTSIELDASGFPVVSFYGAGLWVLHCNDVDCAGGDESLERPDQSAGNVGQYTSLELDAADFPVVSYYSHDGTLAGGGLNVLRCNDANCVGGDESIMAPDPAIAEGQYTSLELDASGYPVVSYQSGFTVGARELMVLHCNDGSCSGGDESIETAALPDDPSPTGISTSIALDSSGFPVVSYRDIDAGFYELNIVHCDDANCAGGDEAIAAPDPGNQPGETTSLALDASGNPLVSYDSDGALQVLHCNDDDCSGGDDSVATPDAAGAGGLGGFFVSLVLDGSGNPVVSHLQFTNFDQRLVHCNDANCEGGDESAATPATTSVSGRTSLALDAAGYPVVAYSGAGVQVLHCNDPNCAGGDESFTMPVTGADGASLALDSSGYPVISYQGTGGVKLLHCNDVNCAGGDESIADPNPDLSGGSWTSLELDSSGFPVVSYSGGSGLRVLHCNDPNCTGGGESIRTVDASGGSLGSLELDSSGFPVLSYADADSDLKLLHCNDTNCAGGNESVTTPGGGIGGQQLSLALDGLGFPVVSYRSVGGLTVLHCNDANCAGGNDHASTPDLDLNAGADYSSIALDASGLPVIAYQRYYQVWVMHCGNMYCDVNDSDLDGCDDVAEAQTDPGSQMSGGRRDSKNFWDFFDVPTGTFPAFNRDGVVSALDFFQLLGRFGSSGSAITVEAALAEPANAFGYHAAYDRGPASGEPWDLTAADGAISGTDFFALLVQFGHTCA